MHKSAFLIGLGALALALGVTDLTSAQAATWHAGTPKVMRHTWFYNGKVDNKAYITYTKTKSTGNLFGLDATTDRYYRLPGYGLKKLKYQSLGHHVYQLSGIQYSPAGQTVQFDGQRMTYKVKVTAKQLHFYKGYHNYVRQVKFTTTKTPAALK